MNILSGYSSFVESPRKDGNSGSAVEPLRIGLCGLGLEEYWKQFPGLKDRLEGYVAKAAAKLATRDLAVVNLGLVDTPDSSRQAGRRCRRADVDVLFLFVTTYAVSSTVLPLAQRAGVPVILLGLQPEATIDYAALTGLPNRVAMTAEWRNSMAFSMCNLTVLPRRYAELRGLP